MDIGLDEEFELIIQNGDFSLVASEIQDRLLSIASSFGELKERPLLTADERKLEGIRLSGQSGLQSLEQQLKAIGLPSKMKEINE